MDFYKKFDWKFVLLFFSIFLALHFLFRQNSVKQLNDSWIKHSLDWAWHTSFPKLNLTTNRVKASQPLEYELKFFEQAAFDKAEQEAIRQGKKTIDISVKRGTYDATPFTQLFLPFLIALFLSTPLSFKKRIPFLLFGLSSYWLSVIIFSVLKIWFIISSHKIGVYESTSTLLKGIYNLSYIGFFTVFIIIIWFIGLILFQKSGFFKKLF